MMGPKKLSAMRDELRQALAKTGRDPIQWLDDRIRDLERTGKSPASATEVLHSLRRILETPKKSKRRSQGVGVKK